MTLRAMAPLLLILLTIQLLVLRDPLSLVTTERIWGKKRSYQRLKQVSACTQIFSASNLLFIWVGLASLGLFIFNFGLSAALQNLGSDVGKFDSPPLFSFHSLPSSPMVSILPCIPFSNFC